MFKHTKKVLASLFILAGITLFISCQEQQPVATNDAGQMNLSKVSSFIMPPGATLLSANLKLYAWSFATNPHTIEIHSITKDWNCPVTWNSFAAAYNPTVTTTFNMRPVNGSPDWNSIDITDTVQAWLDGGTNYGLLLKNQDIIQPLGKWWSNEYAVDPTLRPYLEIVTTAGTFKVEPLIDTYIYSLDASNSYCTEPELYVGFIAWDQTLYEKQTLIRFDIEPTPGGGCTLTPGYWKTHSIYGPAPYDDTWALLLPSGETSPFFLSTKTYFQVLKTSPAGNAYYILSFQYIAAELNFLNGADPSAAQEAFDDATELFELYTPAAIGAMKGSNPIRQQFVALATILNNYNNGLIGPGHCD